MTSKEYENELENESEANAKKAQDLEVMCNKLQKEFEKVQSKIADYK